MAEQATKGADKAQYASVYAKIVARTWVDEAFHQELLKAPGKVLSREGLTLADYLEVELVPGQTGPPKVQLPLPAKPPNVDAQSIRELLAEFIFCCC